MVKSTVVKSTELDVVYRDEVYRAGRGVLVSIHCNNVDGILLRDRDLLLQYNTIPHRLSYHCRKSVEGSDL